MEYGVKDMDIGGKKKGKDEGGEREPGRCALFIKKRGRYCKLPVAKGREYCGEHLTFDLELSGASSHKKRIPCPLDPHHTVYESQLQNHLKKCNAAKKGVPGCYRANVNTCIPEYQPSEEEKKPLSEFSRSQLEAVIAKVEQVYQECMGDMEEVVLEHPVMNPDLSDPANGATALKHIRQQASILGHLEKLQLIQPNTCFIEFGAGRGKLSNCLQRVCVDDDSIRHLLVDRDSCRRKKDVYLRGDPSNEARVQRLNIDIEHLDLSRVEVLQRPEVEYVVAISKHLCGSATDLTLRCLLETLPQSRDTCQPIGSQDSDDVTLHHQDRQADPPDAKRLCYTRRGNPPPKLSGLLIALCCHHRCTWSQLAGTQWMSGRGFSPIDAHLVTKMTSWAVCGVRSPDRHSQQHHNHHTQHCSPSTETASNSSVTMTIDPSNSSVAITTDPTNSSVTATKDSTATMETDSANHTIMATDPTNTVATSSTHSSVTATTASTPHLPLSSNHTPGRREEVGRKCKRVLDLARLHYLRERGMEGKLLYFVSPSTSLENVLLIATPM